MRPGPHSCFMRHCIHRLQDNLVMSAIRFLTTVAKSVHYTLFGADGVLRQVRCASLLHCASTPAPSLVLAGP